LFCNLFIFLFTFIFIYIYNYINYIFIQNSNESTKLRAGWKNFYMLNDFKESDKIDFETEVNIENNEIWVIRNESFFLHNCLLLLTFLKIWVNLSIFEKFNYLCLCIVYINFSIFSFVICSHMLIFISYILIFVCNFFLFTFTFSNLYIYNYINYIFIQNSEKNVTNKSKVFGAEWKNLCMLNDFKEDDKIVFEREVNIQSYEIRVIHLLKWIMN